MRSPVSRLAAPVLGRSAAGAVVDRTGRPGDPRKRRLRPARLGLLPLAAVAFAAGCSRDPGEVLFRGVPPEPTRIRMAGRGCSGERYDLDVAVRDGRVANAFVHNVHVVPERSSGWNFGMPIRGSRRSIRIDRPQIMVPVRCDIHSWMRAYIGVLPHPYFAVSGPDGRFRIGGVPPGEYEVEVRHERFGSRRARVALGPGAEASVEFAYGEEGA